MRVIKWMHDCKNPPQTKCKSFRKSIKTAWCKKNELQVFFIFTINFEKYLKYGMLKTDSINNW